MSVSEVEEIITIESVDVYHLNYDANAHEYQLTAVINGANFRVFRDVLPQSDGQTDIAQKLALIKCKDWYYPLESGVSRVFRFSDRELCYLFPSTEIPDAITVVFPNKAFADEFKRLLFENVLILYASIEECAQQWTPIIQQLRQPSTPQSPAEEVTPQENTERRGSTAEVWAKNIVSGAQVINDGITRGSQYASGLITRGAAHIKANQTADTTPRTVDPKVLSGLSGLRSASYAARKVTGGCVAAVAKGTNQLGNCLAPHVRRHGTKLISSVSGKDETNSAAICDDVITVASGGLQGFATLYNGVTENAKNLCKTFANETVDIVKRKYGNEAANATESVLYCAGNSALTAQNIQQLGPKAIAKKAAINTGKTVFNGEKQSNGEEYQRKT